ncbi:MAG: synthase subunit [Candidatus Kaiserbacteria bacterium]|nr:synthase subunit [Candidatus Kaiserbacteria bacterium]
MQQLFMAFGLDWRLLIIQMVNFGVLLAALSYFLYAPVTKIIDERRKKISEGMHAFEASQQRLLDAQTESEGIVGSAAREAESMVAGARARAEAKGAEIVKAAEEKAQATLKENAMRAEEDRRRILREGEKEIAHAAMLAAETILRQKKA